MGKELPKYLHMELTKGLSCSETPLSYAKESLEFSAFPTFLWVQV